jgi:ribosomal protein S18 acetylase RimI-like enzyme
LSTLAHVRFRLARASDAGSIAELHADSWRRHYRGAYSDAYLDGDVMMDRHRVWQQRLTDRHASTCTIVADDASRIVGFAHTIIDEDARWGSLLDNLHVAHSHMRQGIGSRLLALTAEEVAARRLGSGLYLWVLEQNVAAQAFYRDRGGRCVERAHVAPPGGDRSRLDGSPVKLRYAWPHPGQPRMVRSDSAGSS